MTETGHRETFHSRGWPALVAMIMTLTGCICFIMGCVSAMVVTNRGR